VLPAILAARIAPARAEGDRALSLDLGWATFSAPGQPAGKMAPPSVSPDLGGTLGVIYEHGVSTDVSLRGELAGCLFTGGAGKGQSDPSYAGLGDVGVVFRFDVLKYVPYAFAGVGGLVAGGGPIDRGAQLVVAIGGGLDVLASRSRSWGIEGRLASFGGDVTMFTLGVRGSLRWGYF
jgi:hypothetical protein